MIPPAVDSRFAIGLLPPVCRGHKTCLQRYASALVTDSPTPHRFARALIVEDLDEPREWLAELLPMALPAVRQVDAVASLAAARAMMKTHAYGLALVDWGLPDGNSEGLIGELCAARPDAVVIVATIHDDDAHVFPALRAGAAGYILKSQPAALVKAQLQRLEQGEPALSPSIALRVLQHFRLLGLPAAPGPAEPTAQASPLAQLVTPLTEREQDVLRLIGKGFKVTEAAKILGITPNTASTYIRDIYRKLGINSRAEATMEAARRGLVTLAD